MTCTWLIYQHFSFVWWSCKQQCIVLYYTSCTHLTNLKLLTLIACGEQVEQYVLKNGNGQWLLWFTSSCGTCFLKHIPCAGCWHGCDCLFLSLKFHIWESCKSQVLSVPRAGKRKKLFRKECLGGYRIVFCPLPCLALYRIILCPYVVVLYDC
jgi:hypothetical protein